MRGRCFALLCGLWKASGNEQVQCPTLFFAANMFHPEILYQEFDFHLLQSPDFKEDSVREELVLPLIKALGYTGYQIVRSKTLQHPFLTTGSKKRPVTLIPDYLFRIDDNYAWVLDAKAPNENIRFGDHVEQAYSYAIHPEIRTKFFALCNGKEFILFRHENNSPLLVFDLSDLSQYWESLQRYLAPDSFQSGKKIVYELS